MSTTPAQLSSITFPHRINIMANHFYDYNIIEKKVETYIRSIYKIDPTRFEKALFPGENIKFSLEGVIRQINFQIYETRKFQSIDKPQNLILNELKGTDKVLEFTICVDNCKCNYLVTKAIYTKQEAIDIDLIITNSGKFLSDHVREWVENNIKVVLNSSNHEVDALLDKLLEQYYRILGVSDISNIDAKDEDNKNEGNNLLNGIYLSSKDYDEDDEDEDDEDEDDEDDFTDWLSGCYQELPAPKN